MLKQAGIAICMLATASLTLADGQSHLKARRPTPKTPTELLEVPSEATGRLIVKFTDPTRARAAVDGTLRSLSNVNMEQVTKIIEKYNLFVTSEFHRPDEQVNAILERAARSSGKQQPDLLGMVHVYGGGKNLLAAAKALNNLDMVEWVEIEAQRKVFYKAPVLGGEEECGDCMDCLDCYEPEGQDTPFCDDAACCILVCDTPIDVACCEAAWDSLCAAYANLLCDGGDNCLSPINGSCYVEHDLGGCNSEDCCNTVCDIEAFCCDIEWDTACVELALDNCIDLDGDGPTPDFTGIQGYRTSTPYPDPVSPLLEPFLPVIDGDIFFGYTGQGFDLHVVGEPWTDDNDNGWWDVGENFSDVGLDGVAATNDPGEGDTIWDKPQGLWGISEELLRVYGVDRTGKGNLTRGKTTKIAVIEWAYYEDHEDLRVTTEPGQTLIVIPEVTEPDHATACLSIMGAKDNGRGVTGIAPEAKFYFFPLTSVEQGPREAAAWLSAIDALGAGDVISCSYGPGGSNLNCVQSTHTLITLAADLGICACVAAGNDCVNLDDAPDLGDSGGYVVGACSPGNNFYRLTFSNYARDPDLARGNIVHCKAWGENVVCAGYGDLFGPEGSPGTGIDKNRAYTATFNGTSAATPQVAAALAGLQGLAKQFYGIPIEAGRLRQIIGAPTDPREQQFLHFAFDDTAIPCALDGDPEIEPYTSIGPFINVGRAGAPEFGGSASITLLNQTSAGFDDAGLVDDFLVVRGSRLYGSFFSVKGDDDNVFVTQGVHTQSSYRPPLNLVGLEGTPIPEAAAAKYLATGNITDHIVLAHSDINNANAITVTADLDLTGVFTLVFFEAYNWNTRKWDFLQLEQMPAEGEDGADGVPPYTVPVANAKRYISQSSRRILVRMWTLGFTGIGGPQSGLLEDYETHIDLINVEVLEDFGEG